MSSRKLLCGIGILLTIINLYWLFWGYVFTSNSYPPFSIRLIFLIIIIMILAIFLKFAYPQSFTELSKFKAKFPKFDKREIREENSTLQIPSISKTVNIINYIIGEVEDITRTEKYSVDAFRDKYVTYKVGEHLHLIFADYIKFDSEEDAKKAENDIKDVYGENDNVGYYKSKLEYIIFKYESSNPQTNIKFKLSYILKSVILKSQEQLYDKKDNIIGVISVILIIMFTQIVFLMISCLDNFIVYGYLALVPFVLSVILIITILLYEHSLDDVRNSKSDIYMGVILIFSIIFTLVYGIENWHLCSIIYQLILMVIPLALIVLAALAAAIHFIFYKKHINEINSYLIDE